MQGQLGISRASQAVKRWMVETGTSQGELARLVTEKLGRTTKTPVNQSTISAWVRGAYPPGGLAMVALQEITGAPVTDWIVPAEASESGTKLTPPTSPAQNGTEG